MNRLLFIFDLILLPITLIRLLIIYFTGSRYNINNFEFLDIMMHSANKYFNQQENTVTVDTIEDDIRIKLNYGSRYIKQNIPELENIYNIRHTTDLKQDIPIINNRTVVLHTLNKDQKQDNKTIQKQQANEPVDQKEKAKLFDLIDQYTDENTITKLRSDIDKLNLKLKKVDTQLEYSE